MRSPCGLLALMFFATSLPALAGSITLEGTGTVQAAPDMATINSGVTTQGESARAALDANTAAMSELIAALKSAGIKDRDIQTSGFSVSPNYVYSDVRDKDGYPQPPRIKGYSVSNNVTVIIRDLDKLGSLLDISVTVGANTINGISFSVSDPSALYEEARKAAVANVRAKAETYASAAGIGLGEIESISESQPGNMHNTMPMYARAAMEAEPVPVQTGEMSFAITVRVEWEIETPGK